MVVDSLLNEFKFQILDSVEGLLLGYRIRQAACRRVRQVTERNEILIHFMCLWVGYVRCFPDGRNVDYDEAECRNTVAPPEQTMNDVSRFGSTSASCSG